MAPDGDKFKPVGSEPEVRLNRYGGTPPESPVIVASEAEYVVPTVAFGSVTGLFIVSAGVVQLTVKVCDVPADEPSDAGTVKLMSVADEKANVEAGCAVPSTFTTHDAVKPEPLIGMTWPV